MKRYFDLRAALIAAGQEDDSVFLSYQITDELSAIRLNEQQRVAVIVEILHAFQEFPDADWGVPGPLVHWLEEPLNSELASPLSEAEFLSRPAPQIAVMLNRCVNAARTVSELERYRDLFLEALKVEGLSESMLEVIRYRLAHLNQRYQ